MLSQTVLLQSNNRRRGVFSSFVAFCLLLPAADTVSEGKFSEGGEGKTAFLDSKIPLFLHCAFLQASLAAGCGPCACSSTTAT